MSRYGEEISYSFELLNAGDYKKLQHFSCANKNLDHHITCDLIKNGEIKDEEEHYYFSDDILGTIIKHCREVSEEKAIANYIIVYADKKAEHYYDRNGFEHFDKYMKPEHNMEIAKNIPMYLDLRI